ncbi:glycoside hydrolase family 43 protein [Pseudochryseolinea flava]|uniref:Glycosyl hydrolase family 43 n=1 Tax=Pseudochryseolinea flava TaxID=2059302 RepID=A0A364Y5W8_9BACT|nr:glycoside hydrolase family 43 protein [Pseudochryseolinea flava]RAW02353.1 glycosyl hydrolase family 43 [Pseudochryseolinea flava]
MKFSRNIIIILFALFAVHSVLAQGTFTNPLMSSGADPWSIYKDGYYYYTHTLGNRLDIWRTKNLADLANAERKTIWTPPAGTLYSKDIWAPEIHFLQGKWYVYFAADDGKNETHRLYVLENASTDPMAGEWVFKGKISDETDKWAIDGSVMEINKKLYMVWSGWEGDVNGQQDIYIAQLKNPWTVESSRVKISSPEFEWERHGDIPNDPNNPPHVNVNEGPQFLLHNEKLFVVYSASGCWTDFYTLGMLSTTVKADLLDPKSWTKSKTPVFQPSPEAKVFSPGHNSFFKSPNGKEDWILYHANDEPGQGCGHHRSPRMQKFSWTKDGLPSFGTPVAKGVKLEIPK